MITEKKITAIFFHLKSTSKRHFFAPHNNTNAFVKSKNFFVLPLLWLVSLGHSFEAESKKGFSQLNRWRFSKKAKFLIAVVIIAVFLISIFVFLPKDPSKSNVVSQNGDNSTATPLPTATNEKAISPAPKNKPFTSENTHVAPSFPPALPGLIASAQTLNSTVWMGVAGNAWAYYQPGFGVNVNTGLPQADTGFTGITDWDLGSYIQAVIDAQKLGLIGNDSGWDFSARIDKVLTFLENRPLDPNTNYPFQFYFATTGQKDTSVPQEPSVDAVDTGKLFVALNNLINYNSSLRSRVDDFVFHGRSNYTALLPSVQSDILTSTSIYSYYFDSGFACFWPNLPSPSRILNNLFAAGNVTTYGDVSLPDASISGDPLLCSVFELNNTNPQLTALSRQAYLASEAYYKATGDYAAFSEGNSPYGFIWEWVVLPNGDTWKITGVGSSGYFDVDPIIYTKVAFSFLALYNTTYACNMVVYLEQAFPNPIYTGGYCDGADNNGTLVKIVGNNTNSLILDASLYAIKNNP